MRLATTKTTATAVSRMMNPLQLTKTNQAFSKLGGAARTKATAAIPVSGARDNSHKYIKMGGLALCLGLAQFQLGEADNFFEHKFRTTKNAEDLADLYGTEDFMEIFCVFPFMVSLMMRQAHFDDEGNIHAWGISGPGQLKVTIEFDEEETDTTGDGEPDTITYFNKRETFKDVLPDWLGGKTVWNMVQNFGYRVKEDGEIEVYHHGEHFSGFFPLRLIFQMHARYVIWATEKYVNSDQFGHEDGERAEELRQNIPLHEFQLFLGGLTKQVEEAKANSDDEEQIKKLEVTLKRLQTVSDMDQSKIKPRLMTLRSHKTHMETVHLMVDDKETKDTLQTAMEQIGTASHKPNQPLNAMRNLSRRTTIANQGGK